MGRLLRQCSGQALRDILTGGFSRAGLMGRFAAMLTGGVTGMLSRRWSHTQTHTAMLTGRLARSASRAGAQAGRLMARRVEMLTGKVSNGQDHVHAHEGNAG